MRTAPTAVEASQTPRMRSRLSACRHSLSVLLVGILASTVARAQEPEPRTYANAPVGMNFVVGGYNRQWGSLLVDPALPVDNASATINSFVGAYVRALDVAGRGGKLTVTVPLATSEFRGEYLGQFAQGTRKGIADPRVTFVVNLFGGPALDRQRFAQWRQRTLVGASMQVSIPLGQYDSSKIINLGANRWGFRPGLGVSHQAGNWIVESAASVAFFTANNAFAGTHRFEQRPLGVFEASAIRYFTPRVWGAAHAVWVAGGAAVLDERQGARGQVNSRLGASFSFPAGRGQSLKLGLAESAITRFGNDFASLSIVYQRGW